MGALTKDTPKPLISVCNQPLIDHTLNLIDNRTCGPIIVNVHYHAEKIINHLKGRNILISDESDAILETGGGLKHAMATFAPDASASITMNSDVIWRGEDPLKKLITHWNPVEMDALLAMVPLSRCIGRQNGGDANMNSSGRLTWRGDFVFGGIQIIKPSLVTKVNKTAFSLKTDVWDALEKKGKLFGVSIEADWCDVGHPVGIDLAERLLCR